MEFPPPPPGSGAGQQQPVSNAGAHAPHNAMPEGQQFQAYPPPPALEGQYQAYQPSPQPPHSNERESQQNPPQLPAKSPLRRPLQQEHEPEAYELPPPKPPRPQQSEQPGMEFPPQGRHVSQTGAYQQQPLYSGPPQVGGLQPGQQTHLYDPSSYLQPNQGGYVPPPPPRRRSQNFGDDDPGNPIHFTRDPHKLIAYLVPFPKPQLQGVDPNTIPSRFLIYTPPPPPLGKPAEGDKEAKLHKVQRKWQEEVRSAKTSTAKTASWQGVKSKATRGISKAMTYTTTSNLDFLGRVSGHKSDSEDEHANDKFQEGDTTKKTVGVEEMVLIYPPTMNLDQQQMREEFVNTMLRTKTKAQRDAIIATGLMPVAYGIDILATFVWPFGGLGEIDTVWAYANIRGAKTARSVTKRLSSSAATGDLKDDDTLHLNFTPSPRIEILRKYLDAECHKSDAKLFPAYLSSPTESDVLEAIGWNPRQNGGENKNWEDEQWELNEVKDDLRLVMHKGAKEWKKWCTAYAKDPEKAMKK